MCACLHTQQSRLHGYVCGLHSERLVSHWILQINGCQSIDGWVLCNDPPVQTVSTFCQTAREEVTSKFQCATLLLFIFKCLFFYHKNGSTVHSHTKICVHSGWADVFSLWWSSESERDALHFSVRQTNEDKRQPAQKKVEKRRFKGEAEESQGRKEEHWVKTKTSYCNCEGPSGQRSTIKVVTLCFIVLLKLCRRPHFCSAACAIVHTLDRIRSVQHGANVEESMLQQ